MCRRRFSPAPAGQNNSHSDSQDMYLAARADGRVLLCKCPSDAVEENIQSLFYVSRLGCTRGVGGKPRHTTIRQAPFFCPAPYIMPLCLLLGSTPSAARPGCIPLSLPPSATLSLSLSLNRGEGHVDVGLCKLRGGTELFRYFASVYFRRRCLASS